MLSLARLGKWTQIFTKIDPHQGRSWSVGISLNGFCRTFFGVFCSVFYHLVPAHLSPPQKKNRESVLLKNVWFPMCYSENPLCNTPIARISLTTPFKTHVCFGSNNNNSPSCGSQHSGAGLPRKTHRTIFHHQTYTSCPSLVSHSLFFFACRMPSVNVWSSNHWKSHSLLRVPIWPLMYTISQILCSRSINRISQTYPLSRFTRSLVRFTCQIWCGCIGLSFQQAQMISNSSMGISRNGVDSRS